MKKYTVVQGTSKMFYLFWIHVPATQTSLAVLEFVGKFSFANDANFAGEKLAKEATK